MLVAATTEALSKRAHTRISSKRRTLETVKRSKKSSRKKKPAHPAARQKSARPNSSSAKRIVNIRQLGDVVNLKERRLYMLRHEGMPQIAPGKFDLRACLRWYVRYLQRKIAARANGLGSSATAAAGASKITILALNGEMKKMHLAERREQLISAEKVQKDLRAIVREIRRRFAGLPKKLAAEVVGVTDLAGSQVLIERLLKNALSALSEFDPDDVEAVATASTSRSSSRARMAKP